MKRAIIPTSKSRYYLILYNRYHKSQIFKNNYFSKNFDQRNDRLLEYKWNEKRTVLNTEDQKIKIYRLNSQFNFPTRSRNFPLRFNRAPVIISVLRSWRGGRARVTQLVISIVYQAKLKTPLFPPRQPCNQFVSSLRGSLRVRTPANCPRTLFYAQNHARTRVHVTPVG